MNGRSNASPTGPIVPIHFSGPSYEQRLRKGKKSGKWRATYRVQMPGWSKPQKRSKGGFATKRQAEKWAERLAHAFSLSNGWSFDEDGQPVAATDEAVSTVTVLEDLEELVEAVGRHEWRSDSHYDRQRSVLARAAIHLLDDPALIGPLMDAWEGQKRSRKERPEPTADMQWAARYLREEFLTRVPTPVEQLDEGLRAGRRWLEHHSQKREDLLVDGALRLLHNHLVTGDDGRTRRDATCRTYWGLIRRFCKRLADRGVLPHDVSASYFHAKRDPDHDKVDPRRVPDEPTIWRIALAIAGKTGRVVEGMLVLVMAYCALRIGEACDLRRRDVKFLPGSAGGGAWLVVYSQWNPPSKDDGGNDAPSRPTKGHRSEAAGSRDTYLGRRVAWFLRIYMTVCVADHPDAPLFPGRRARRVEPDTFRRDHWTPTIKKLFPDPSDPYNSLTPHDLRAAGMTRWLRSGVPDNHVASWGGWSSKKIMLDVYEGVLPDDDDYAIWVVEGRRGTGRRRPFRADMSIAQRTELATEIWAFRSLLRSAGR